MEKNELIEKDLKHLWHPCSQMKDYETFKPLVVESAHGSYFVLSDGKKIIDAISSWWCKSLGHQHPRIIKAIKDQLEKFEQIILANTTYSNIVTLSEKLSGLTNHCLNKVSYASDGSSAVEMALKMSLQSRVIQQKPHKKQLLSLSGAYHGETALALSVSDLGIYKKPYESVLVPCTFIRHIPYVKNTADPLWHNCDDYWNKIEPQLERVKENLTAIIIEPIVQAANGMQIYSQDFLRRIRDWTFQHDIHLIADEIMTGLGRTGYNLACDHAGIIPDFICLGKGLTGGALPLSCVLTSEEIYAVFYDDYEKNKSFLHSHTHSGNALAVSAALETLSILEDENILQTVQDNEKHFQTLMQSVADNTQKLTNVRNIGAMAAADLTAVSSKQTRLGYAVYQEAVKLGALLRPLGNTIYWCPPLNTPLSVLQDLKEITEKAITLTFENVR